MPDGPPHRQWWTAEALTLVLAQTARTRTSGTQQATDQPAESNTEVEMVEGVDGFDHPDATRIRPGWRGERFDLHECVQALFRMQQLTPDSQAA